MTLPSGSNGREPIAIIGIGCRFPGGVDGPAAFWQLLSKGVDAVTTIPPNRWGMKMHYHPDPRRPGKTYTQAGGFLDKLDLLDAGFFGLSGREASRLDPQHRLLLEVAWEALENAGLAVEQWAGKDVGVFVGISQYDYLTLQSPESVNAYSAIGGALCAAPNRISYLFDFRGPSQATDTACSSAMTSFHDACQSLWRGESVLALAGGVNALLSPGAYIGFSKASMLSQKGRCRAFDADADGFVRAEGAGMVVLKPLSRAVADGDPIYAAVLATGVNQDGRTSGMSLPNQAAQEALLRKVYSEAGVSPRQVQYVEAHGTGTRVGDPIECGALGKVLGQERPEESFLRIGSVKTNIGHLEPAAGIAGLIKLALCLSHRALPASLHFKKPNPEIPFDTLGLRVQTELGPWPQPEAPLVAGVNSFGFGGTNGHAVLTEFKGTWARPADPRPGQAHLFAISARGTEALKALAGRYAGWLEENASISLRDLCHSASVRRGHLEDRLAIVASDVAQLGEQLAAFQKLQPSAASTSGHASGRCPKLAFVFCGNGPQWWGMGRELLKEEPVFRTAVEKVDHLFRCAGGCSILEELCREESQARMDRTDVAQPCLFALQVGLLELWRSWGVEPDATLGHSVGEIAAAYAAGRLHLEDAVKVIHHRSRTQERTAGKGRMAAVGVSAEEAGRLVEPYRGRLSVAGQNSPNSSTLSGEAGALGEVRASLERRNVFWRDLPINYAFHSDAMDPIREDLVASLRELRPTTERLPFVSTVTGASPDGRDLDADYWWDNVRCPVLFGAGVDRLIDDGFLVFLELGPHPVLAGYLADCLAARGKEGTLVASLRRREPERAALLGAAGKLYARGCSVDWRKLYPEGTFLPIPNYPWQRERHWFAGEQEPPKEHPLLGARADSLEPEWRVELDLARAPYLEDHKVLDAVVFPAAGVVEMALALAAETLGEGPYALEEIELPRPLVLPESEALSLRTVFSPEDGRFEIRKEGESRELPHVRGQLHRRGGPLAALPSFEELRHRCPKPFTQTEFYEAALARRINYGPRFQGLRKVWGGADEAVGEVELSERLLPDLSTYRLHPALLDSCFQLTLAAQLGSRHEKDLRTFVPVKIKRFSYYRAPGRTVTARTLIVERGEDAITVDCLLWDAAGSVVAEIEGLRGQAMRLGAVEGSSDCLYRYQWTYQPRDDGGELSRTDLPDPREIARGLGSLSQRLSQRYGEIHTLSSSADRICTAYIVEAFAQLGWEMSKGQAIAPDVLRKRLGVVSEHARLFGRLLEILEHDGFLLRSAHGWTVARKPRLPEAAAMWKALAGRLTESHASTTLLQRCGSRLARLLRGEANSLEVLFPQGQSTLLEHLYDTDPTWLPFNVLVQAAFGQIAVGLPRSRPLRILEVGAGTGGVTSWVLPVLPEDRTDYLYTDVSEVFLSAARRRFEGFPFMKYATLDIERDPAEQGIPVHAFDVVLAADVLHATRDLGRTLENVKRLLKPQGFLVLMEITQKPRWLDLTFGLLKGWWLFEDLERRPSHPLLGRPQWLNLLSSSGFVSTALLPPEGMAPHLGHSVLLASVRELDTASAAAEERVAPDPEEAAWLLFADGGGVGDGVRTKLLEQGSRVVVVRPGRRFRRLGPDLYELAPGRRSELGLLLRRIKESSPGLRGVVHLWSLDSRSDDPSTEELVKAQRLGCLSVIKLVQALSKARFGTSLPRLWLVTRGAQGLEGERLALAQAPLWGVGRVLMNEHPELRTTLVDLGGPDDAVEKESRGLLLELRSESSGPVWPQELLLRGEARYAGQLVRAAPSAVAGNKGWGARDNFALEIPHSGVLDDLRLRAHPRGRPGPGELEVEVVAAGLNFRDLMLTSGLLSGEAVEGGYAGRSIGLEYAGRVVAIGRGVKGFRIGDEVMGSGKSCFARFVTVRAKLGLKKPASMSFEDAVTLPVAFATASYALEHMGRLRRGERVLIHGAAGGVGLAAIQIVQRAGGEVFATAGSEEKRDYLRAIGVTHVMDSRTLEFADEIRRLTGGEGVHLVLNCLSGDFISRSLGVLRPFGRFLELGKRDMIENSRLGLRAFRNNLSYYGIDIDQMFVGEPDMIRDLLRSVIGRLARGEHRSLPHRVFPVSRAVEAFRHLQQSRHIGKVVLSIEDRCVKFERPLEEPPRFSAKATYLITGGLGGFGLATAQWMADHGAMHLVLVGRRGAATPEAGAGVLALRGKGVRVSAARADVTKEQDVARLLAGIRKKGPPLRGIVHAAMVLDDKVVLRMDEENLWKALRPKLLGAWHLDRMTRETPLDFFVMYSSSVSILGNPGQANYAAANAFLDSLASHRARRGRPALTVSWGAIGEVGYVARHRRIGKSLTGHGVELLRPGSALRILGGLLHEDWPQVGVMQMDWKLISEAFGDRLAKLSRLVKPGAPKAVSGEEPGRFLTLLKGAPPEKGLELVLGRLVEHMSRVLRVPDERVDREKAVTALGLDSLMAVELRQRVLSDFGVELSVMEVLHGSTLAELAQSVHRTLESKGRQHRGSRPRARPA